MLNPDSRTLFLDALRPPDGFELDSAIATTYSLDLTAMLLAPLAFARLDGFRRQDEPGKSGADLVDPFALLKSIRMYAERTIVFCQAGRISVPRSYQRLYAYLEQSIVPVTPTSELGVFHPKMWALRMSSDDGEVRYRVLCLSRNLTFDSSWDTALVLDGVLDQDRSRAIAANHPLGDFFAALPGLAVGAVGERNRKMVERTADELRRVNFELPDDFDRYFFAPIGIAGKTGMPFEKDRCDKRFVVSPFVTDGALAKLPGQGGALVSRIEELDQLKPETLALFESVHVLTDAADQLEDEPELDGPPSSDWAPPPTGLHAKLYVVDEGWDAWVWSGSANASTAAFEQNVEFQVALRGKKSKVGVEVTQAALGPLLETYRGTGRTETADDDAKKLERALRKLRATLARVEWSATAKPTDEGLFQVTFGSEAPVKLPEGATLQVWPVTLTDPFARDFGATKSVAFAPCSFEALTSFFALRLVMTLGESKATEEFVVHAPLSGAPENRLARILDSMLSNPEAVLRFLRLLLASNAFAVLEALADGDGEATGGTNGSTSRNEAPLLESMLRALAQEPARLDAIEQVVNDLMKTENGAARLPTGFLEAWEPIRAARLELGRKS